MHLGVGRHLLALEDFVGMQAFVPTLNPDAAHGKSPTALKPHHRSALLDPARSTHRKTSPGSFPTSVVATPGASTPCAPWSAPCVSWSLSPSLRLTPPHWRAACRRKTRLPARPSGLLSLTYPPNSVALQPLL
ncbi:hypothetical protein E2562_032564 [Oryza meyeriana var. granulata]|uniref:Uncharacterized protein n=1 Tax=Oryza meyeriana var. granulata TaxID=110450 RepID=A0A6G1CU73_9ORYZ|nr:hypothetical protein E2562_032564 [Oryza meyeriana var. granulata]